MKRRSFLQFFGLAAPAAVVLPAAAKFAETAAKLEPKAPVLEPSVPVYETVRGEGDTYCTISCGSCVAVLRSY
jgi:hypothetical protein